VNLLAGEKGRRPKQSLIQQEGLREGMGSPQI